MCKRPFYSLRFDSFLDLIEFFPLVFLNACISVWGQKRERERKEDKLISTESGRGEAKGEGGEKRVCFVKWPSKGDKHIFFFFDKHIYQERGLAHKFTLCPKNDLYFECYGSGLVAKSCSILATPWTEKPDRLQFMGFSRQEYWSELPFPSPGDLPNPGIEPRFPAL